MVTDEKMKKVLNKINELSQKRIREQMRFWEEKKKAILDNREKS